jgi:hypothetical protein
MTLRGQLRSRPSSPSTHQPKRACILRLQLLAGAQAAPAFLCITSPDIIIIYHRALHEQLFHCPAEATAHETGWVFSRGLERPGFSRE